MPSSPSTPSTPNRRRSAGIRRPRVAGRVPAAGRPGAEPPAHDDARPGRWAGDTLARPQQEAAGPEVATADAATTEVDPPEQDTDVLSGAAATPPAVDLRKRAPVAEAPPGPGAAARPAGKRLGRRERRPRPPDTGTRRRPLPIAVLAGALVVLLGLAVFFGVSNAELRGTPAARNTALTDVGATAQVSQQLGDDLKAVYSFDFARLDQNEAAARAAITPAFRAQFDQLFGQVRRLAPQQQAVVTATVASSAVREIDGDRAVMVVFLDQQATRAQSGNQPQQLAAAGRLTVTGQLVDGTWKIADVQAQ